MLTINNLDKIIGYSITDMFFELMFTDVFDNPNFPYQMQYRKTSLYTDMETIGIIRLNRTPWLSPDDKKYELSSLNGSFRFISAPKSQWELLNEIGQLLYVDGHPFTICERPNIK